MKFIRIICVAVLLATMFPIYASANTKNPVHYSDQTTYAEKKFDHLLDMQMTFGAKVNKNYQAVKGYFTAIKQRINDFKNYYKNEVQTKTCSELYPNGSWSSYQNLECYKLTLQNLGKHIAFGGSIVLGAKDIIGDFFDMLFGKEDTIDNSLEVFDTFLFVNQYGRIQLNDKYDIYRGENKITWRSMSTNIYSTWYRITFIPDSGAGYNQPYIDVNNHALTSYQNSSQFTQVSVVLRDLQARGLITIRLKTYDPNNPNSNNIPLYNVLPNNEYNDFVNNIFNNNYVSNYLPSNYEPVMILQVACQGQQYNAVYNKNDDNYYINNQLVTFYDDGTVSFGTNDCNAVWKEPIIELDETNDDEPIEDIKITDGTGETTTIKDKEKPNCDGVLCWLSSLWDGIKDIGKFTKDLVSLPLKIGEILLSLIGDLMNALKDLLIWLLVPNSQSYSDFVEELNTLLTNKFNLPSVSGSLNDIENPSLTATDYDTSNGFQGIKVTGLMGTGEVKIIDNSTINNALPTIHNWTKGVFFVLLAFFNINMMYRFIRGHTLMGFGVKNNDN